MLLCLGGSQADLTFAMFDTCHAWIQKHFCLCIRFRLMHPSYETPHT